VITNLVVLNILMTLILESSAAVQQELQAKVPDVPDDSADAPQRTWSRGKVGWTISTCNIYIYMYYAQRLGFAQALQCRGSPFPIKCCCNSAFHWEDQQRY